MIKIQNVLDAIKKIELHIKLLEKQIDDKSIEVDNAFNQYCVEKNKLDKIAEIIDTRLFQDTISNVEMSEIKSILKDDDNE
jgi:hypothetical protein